MEEVRLNLQQLREVAAEANRQQVALDSGLVFESPLGPSAVPQTTGKKKRRKSQRCTEMPTIFLGGVSNTAASFPVGSWEEPLLILNPAVFTQENTSAFL